MATRQIVRRIVIASLLVLMIALLGLGGLIVAFSPGKLSQLRGPDGTVIAGSLSERVVVSIGGVDQGMFIQSADPSNPVLLFLHGGPGMPEFFMNAAYPTELEQHFTVVWWEQRGAGMSFSAVIPPESMTLDSFITDTVEVADYLRGRFGQDKIYLLGHSWGSFLGIQVAAQAPDRFHAYIGMGQVTYQLQSEVLAHQNMIDAYRDLDDLKMVRNLEAAPVSLSDGLSPAYLRLRDGAMHGLGVGTTRDMHSVISGVFLPVWMSRAYSVREKINIWRGIGWSRRFLWSEFLETDLRSRVTDLDLPVYFLVGAHDLTANGGLSSDLFDQITAPLKGFYTFDDSAHSPLFEEPEGALDILLNDVLRNRTDLADARNP